VLEIFAKDKVHAVAFINPPGPAKLYRSMYCTYISKANYIWQPQDFINLSAHIPQDSDLKFFDCSINNMSEEDLFKELSSNKPDLCIIALSSIVYDEDMKFLKNFGRHFPDIKIIALGDIFLEKIFWERGLEYADGLVLNSIDVDLSDYIKSGVSHSPNLVLKDDQKNTVERESKSPPKKVSIGIPRHELFINKKYRFPFVKSYLYSTVTTQFGCPFSCAYCTQCKIPVTYRDYNEILKEIEKVYHLGIRDLFFGDPSFGFPKENALLLLEGMVGNNFSMRWACYANPALLNSEMLNLMKRAGCHTVIIGVEDEDLDMLRERYKRTLSKSRLIEFCEECSRLGIRICGDFIIGLNSDKDAVNRMVDFAKKLKLDYASFNIFTVLFGSKVREDLIKEGKIDPYAVGSDTSGTFGKEGREKLIELRNMAVKKFYMRPSYIIRRLTRISSLSEFLIQIEEMRGIFKGI
jgi:radical SAM superfamily enzyme YgiQ (UPF0313 family)